MRYRVTPAERAQWFDQYDDVDLVRRLIAHAERIRSDARYQPEGRNVKRSRLRSGQRRRAVDALVDLVSVRGRNDELTGLARRALADSDPAAFEDLIARVEALPDTERERLFAGGGSVCSTTPGLLILEE